MFTTKKEGLGKINDFGVASEKKESSSLHEVFPAMNVSSQINVLLSSISTSFFGCKLDRYSDYFRDLG